MSFENENFVSDSISLNNISNDGVKVRRSSSSDTDKNFLDSIKKMKPVSRPEIVITQDSQTTDTSNNTLINNSGLLSVNINMETCDTEPKPPTSSGGRSHTSNMSVSVISPNQDLMIENECNRTKNSLTHHLVETRAVILKIGEIDTLNEKFYAEAFIEAIWIDFNIEPSSQKYNPDKDWNPKLYILNSIGELKQQVWYSQYSITEFQRLEKERSNEKPFIIENNYMNFYSKGYKQSSLNFFDKASVILERRRISGQFWQTLDLKDFPADVQNLTISFSSLKQVNEIQLYQSKEKPSSLNIRAFVDSQEWKLYKHLTVREYLKDSIFSVETFPAIDLTINVARKPTFYYLNAFFFVFLISLASLSVFSIRCHLNANRIQTTSTLLLTSVTFKWITNRSLPTVSYMTSLDKYSIGCMLLICGECIWHAIISSMLDLEQKCDSNFSFYDHIAFVLSCLALVLIQIVFLVWLFKNAYKKRRLLDCQELDYTNELIGKRSTRLKSMLYGI